MLPTFSNLLARNTCFKTSMKTRRNARCSKLPSFAAMSSEYKYTGQLDWSNYCEDKCTDIDNSAAAKVEILSIV